MYRKVVESQTLLINTQSKIMTAQNKKVIAFGFGQSPFAPPANVVKALKASSDRREYSSVQGDAELRALMASFHNDHNGLSVDPGKILLAPGSKILIFSIFLAFKQADVFIPAPSWVSYAPQAQLCGHHIIKIPTSFKERWRICPAAIQDSARMKKHQASILILNYPGNPDGLTYSEEELKNIAMAAKAQNMLVISDEIYGFLNHAGNHRSLANYYPHKTITTTGLSKWCGAGGWRLGAAFVHGSEQDELMQSMIGIGSETYSCAPVPVQIAAKTAYRSFEEIKPYLERQGGILSQIGAFCSLHLTEAGIRTHSPQGGFYLFPDFSLHKTNLEARGITTSALLCKRLLEETGVALLPASAFGFEPEFLAARLAYVDFTEPHGNGTLQVPRDCPRVAEGIDKIISWIQAM